MKRYVSVVVALMALFLAGFVVVEPLRVPVLTHPSHLLGNGGVVAAIVSVGLLVGDVVLPVPSSGVMVANGALFGAVVGAVLSLAGAVGAAVVGFALGRRGGPLLDRVVKPEERRRADALLKRWGTLAILVTNPVPIFAETVAVLAGASPMRPPKPRTVPLYGLQVAGITGAAALVAGLAVRRMLRTRTR